jgi:hypothetical protein
VEIVPTAPQRLFDPFRRLVEFTDAHASPETRDGVAELLVAIGRGGIDVHWIRETFSAATADLAVRLRHLDRAALRVAHATLVIVEPVIVSAVRKALVDSDCSALPLRVVNAVSEVVGAITKLEGLAKPRRWFIGGAGDREPS